MFASRLSRCDDTFPVSFLCSDRRPDTFDVEPVVLEEREMEEEMDGDRSGMELWSARTGEGGGGLRASVGLFLSGGLTDIALQRKRISAQSVCASFNRTYMAPCYA